MAKKVHKSHKQHAAKKAAVKVNAVQEQATFAVQPVEPQPSVIVPVPPIPPAPAVPLPSPPAKKSVEQSVVVGLFCLGALGGLLLTTTFTGYAAANPSVEQITLGGFSWFFLGLALGVFTILRLKKE